MGLPDTGRAQEDHVFLALEEAELMETLDLLSLDRRLKGEIELVHGLDRRQARGAHGGLQPPIVAQRDLRVEQRVDRGRTRQLAAVNAREYLVERFQCPGHLEVRELALDPLAQRPRGGRPHAVASTSPA
jgi:hypothetical protein